MLRSLRRELGDTGAGSSPRGQWQPHPTDCLTTQRKQGMSNGEHQQWVPVGTQQWAVVVLRMDRDTVPRGNGSHTLKPVAKPSLVQIPCTGEQKHLKRGNPGVPMIQAMCGLGAGQEGCSAPAQYLSRDALKASVAAAQAHSSRALQPPPGLLWEAHSICAKALFNLVIC